MSGRYTKKNEKKAPRARHAGKHSAPARAGSRRKWLWVAAAVVLLAVLLLLVSGIGSKLPAESAGTEPSETGGTSSEPNASETSGEVSEPMASGSAEPEHSEGPDMSEAPNGSEAPTESSEPEVSEKPEGSSEPEVTAKPESPGSGEPDTPSDPAEAGSEDPIGESAEGFFDLGSGLQITEYLSYTGVFMEDRTDELVQDVLAIRVTNTGDKCIQTMDISLLAEETAAEFTLSTLLPGETMIVLEKNRMAYDTALDFTDAKTANAALFSAPPTLCEDRIGIQCLDGVLNVTNVSGEDITEDVYIYYKNCMGGVYYGGITYRVRVGGGLKAGEIRQGAAEHFDPDNSVVVFVTCG